MAIYSYIDLGKPAWEEMDMHSHIYLGEDYNSFPYLSRRRWPLIYVCIWEEMATHSIPFWEEMVTHSHTYLGRNGHLLPYLCRRRWLLIYICI